MVPVDRGRLVEPAGFDAACRVPGNEWLAAHPEQGRPPAYWSAFKAPLADGFFDLCAYCAMNVPDGTVDHFVSISEDRSLAYEWTNYRFASGGMNSSKGRASSSDLLDPFAVGAGWFVILLPSLQMVPTDQIPVVFRERAKKTLARLGLIDDERVIRQRRQWYAMYQNGRLSIDGLRQMAPLIAEAVVAAGELPVLA